MRREALDRERPGDADLPLVFVGFVVEVFELGLGGDGGVDLLLAGDALPAHHSACSFFAASGHLSSASRGISHSCQFFLSAALSCSRSGSSICWHFSQMTSISALFAMDFKRDVRHALVDEALTDVAVRRSFGWQRSCDFRFLELAVAASRRADSKDNGHP